MKTAGLIIAIAAASAAHAQPGGQTPDPRLAHRIVGPTALGKAGGTITPTIEVPAPRTAFPLRYVPAETAPLPGFAKTAIDHRFAAGEEARVTGSVGYLCGLRPSPNETNGPVSSYESVGTFLGAKVSYAF